MGLLTLWLWGCGMPEVSVSPAESVSVAPAQMSRERRRMNIDQLQASIASVTGGLSWHEEVDGVDTDLFSHLSVTLGKPDYLASTEEELVPGLLFQKFLEDASQSVCSELIALEQGRGESDRIFLVYADFDDPPGGANVADNMRHALLRFHGRDVMADDASLEPWLTLHADALAVSGQPTTAWQVVCIALLTHPDFYSF